jgi:hypothetical protein
MNQAEHLHNEMRKAAERRRKERRDKALVDLVLGLFVVLFIYLLLSEFF